MTVADSYGLPPALLHTLQKAGFATPLDLLLHFPLRHEDWQTQETVSTLRVNTTAVIKGKIIATKIIPARRRQLLVTLEDARGDTINLRFFHITPGLSRMLENGREISVRGKTSFQPRRGWEMAHPKFTVDSSPTSRTIYPAVKNQTPAQLQKLIRAVLNIINLPPTVPVTAAEFDGSDWTLKRALQTAHAPAKDGSSPLDDTHPCWQRLRFEELVAHQIALRRRYYARKQTPVNIMPPDGWQAELEQLLPFTLTAAQKKAMREIAADLAAPYPMRRLLQGDVGSGKTIVAAAACYLTVRAGYRAALMAPTEILAEQHYRSLSLLLEKMRLRCELITGSLTAKQRREAEDRLRFGLSTIAIGTHALFQENTLLPQLGLVVIDEQHRFGVEQRQLLVEKGVGVHQLMMSATPIPRTLALALYADMDVSVLDEKPAGRQPVRTTLCANDRRGDIITRVALHIKTGGFVYWVCPLIEESDKSALTDVHTLAAEIRATAPDLAIGIIHGRMKSAEKNTIMKNFQRGKYRLLIATTVIEVGVDVAQADIMIIEHADRMGLSQLHQLRGRVGRGKRAGTCVLLYQPPLSDEARERLQTMRQHNDGFHIAEKDLVLRGPGEWLGSRQSGLPSLRVARLGQDDTLARAARQAAEWMLKHDKRACVRHLTRWFGDERRQSTATGAAAADSSSSV